MSIENGYNPEHKKTLFIKEEIERAFHYNGIKGLEKLGLSDAEILRDIPSNYGGIEDTINRLYEAGWDFDRIDKAQKEAKYQWTEEIMKESYEKAEQRVKNPDFQSEISEIEALVGAFEELQEYAEELKVDIPVSKESSKEIEKLKSVVDELYQRTHIILAEKYLELAKIAEKEGNIDLFETLVDNANLSLTFTSPPENLIKSLEEMRKRLKPR
ncbi:hypothetical protein KJ854_02905 [Patescibacteria group bacterium]|nr:hypothetical protein [Patescibacteria group bacterium]MBU4141591.1 hypothetical protein [Patescibacteria group bacterium]